MPIQEQNIVFVESQVMDDVPEGGKREKNYFALMLVLETFMIGVFAATDVFLFYVFFELTLVPMYFIIGIWGGANRVYAAIKFFLYTLLGSVLMLVAIAHQSLRAHRLPGEDTAHDKSHADRRAN